MGFVGRGTPSHDPSYRDANVGPVIEVGLEHLLRDHVDLWTDIFILHYLRHRMEETKPRTHHLGWSLTVGVNSSSLHDSFYLSKI